MIIAYDVLSEDIILVVTVLLNAASM